MGFEKFKRPLLASRGAKVGSSGFGVTEAVQSLSASNTAQTLSLYGPSILTYNTSGVKADFILPNPARAGVSKDIVVVKGCSSEELNINTASTAVVFAGTTFNTVTIASSTVNPFGSFALRCVSVSTSQWAVSAVGSTLAWDFAATTGSTATA